MCRADILTSNEKCRIQTIPPALALTAHLVVSPWLGWIVSPETGSVSIGTFAWEYVWGHPGFKCFGAARHIFALLTFAWEAFFGGKWQQIARKKLKRSGRKSIQLRRLHTLFFLITRMKLRLACVCSWGGGLLAVYPTYYFRAQSNTFVPRGTGKFLGTFVLFSKCSDPLCGNDIIQ